MTSNLQATASQVRRDIVRMVHAVQSGHPGGSLGCADFLTALYFHTMNHHSQNFNMDGTNVSATQGKSFSFNILAGTFLTASVPDGDSSAVLATGMIGNGLIVTGSTLPATFAGVDVANGGQGSLFAGRFNSIDGTKDMTAETVFAVGTGTSFANRKTGFLIDSGSNTFVEGTLNVSGATSLNGDLIITGSLTASLQQGYVWVGNASGITTTVSTSSFGGGGGTIPAGTISGSAQITALGFVSSSVTASSLITASFDNGTRNLTFTKGDATTFAVNIPDVSGSTINTASFATTGSNLFIGNQTITGSVSIQGQTTFTLSNGDQSNVRLGSSAMGNAITNGNAINVAIGNSAMQNTSGSTQNLSHKKVFISNGFFKSG